MLIQRRKIRTEDAITQLEAQKLSHDKLNSTCVYKQRHSSCLTAATAALKRCARESNLRGHVWSLTFLAINRRSAKLVINTHIHASHHQLQTQASVIAFTAKRQFETGHARKTSANCCKLKVREGRRPQIKTNLSHYVARKGVGAREITAA